MWGFPSADSFLQDVRYGARLLRRSPAFTAVAVLSLALGLGTSAAVFSLADALLWRELPVGSPSRLIGFRWIAGPQMPASSLRGNSWRTETETSSTAFSLPTFRALSDRGSRYADIFGFGVVDRVSLSSNRIAEIGSAMLVSGNYFRALGLAPAVGRLLVTADDGRNAPAVALLSYAYWLRRFGGNADAVGQTIAINGVSYTIVGVMPRGFHGTGQVDAAVDVVVPIAMHDGLVRASEPADDPDFWWVLVMGRLHDDVTAEQARGPLDLIVKQSVMTGRPSLAAADLPRLVLFSGARGQDEVRGRMRDPLRIMLLVVSIVLLVACTNVANLLLARGRARAREMAVRAVVGAPRRRMVRQLLTEGLVLAALGAAGGVLFARWLAAALVPALTRSDRPLAIDLVIDWRFVVFTITIATACSVIFALVPAFQASNVQLTPGLQEAGRGVVGRRRRLTLSSSLIAGQIALCLVLVATAGLLVTSVRNLERTPTGFDPTNLLLFRIDPTLSGYDEARTQQFYTAALERLRALPGVRSATILTHALMSRSSWISIASLPGLAGDGNQRPDKLSPDDRNAVWRQNVDHQFFAAFGIPILRGRGFDAARPASTRVAVVSRRMADHFFPGEDPIGRQFNIGGRPGTPVEIIGVAGDAKYSGLRTEFPRTVYFDHRQHTIGPMTFAVKTDGDPLALGAAVRDVMAQLDPSVPVDDLRTQQMQILQSIRMERLFARLASLLGVVVLLLAAVGLCGVVAYSVERRTGEIGIRMALGAQRAWVRRMVLRESLALACAGVIVGVPAALTGTRAVRTLLFGLEPGDPVTIVASALLLLGVALAAAYVPARRASRVDPLVALRAE